MNLVGRDPGRTRPWSNPTLVKPDPGGTRTWVGSRIPNFQPSCKQPTGYIRSCLRTSGVAEDIVERPKRRSCFVDGQEPVFDARVRPGLVCAQSHFRELRTKPILEPSRQSFRMFLFIFFLFNLLHFLE